MYKPKYDYKAVIQDIQEHGVNISKFKQKCQQMSGGETIQQSMFEFIYECLVVNNYNIDIMF